jgi:hypothetical protein
MEQRNRLTCEEHVLWGRELRHVQLRLRDLSALLSESYPMARRSGAAQALETIDTAQHYLTHTRDAFSIYAELYLPELAAVAAQDLYCPKGFEPVSP